MRALVADGAYLAKDEVEWKFAVEKVILDSPSFDLLFLSSYFFFFTLLYFNHSSSLHFVCEPSPLPRCQVQNLVVEAGLQHAGISLNDRESSSSADLEMELARCSEVLSDHLLRAVTLVPNEVEFPLEHLLAVYLPMWMPLAMPLIAGLLKPPPPAGV